jgi:hypothetical protein
MHTLTHYEPLAIHTPLMAVRFVAANLEFGLWQRPHLFVVSRPSAGWRWNLQRTGHCARDEQMFGPVAWVVYGVGGAWSVVRCGE